MSTRFYPIYMLVVQFSIIVLSIEFGPMLISERLVRVNKRTDGGRGQIKAGAGKQIRVSNLLRYTTKMVEFGASYSHITYINSGGNYKYWN